MNVLEYMQRTHYAQAPRPCIAFAADVWLDLTGDSIHCLTTAVPSPALFRAFVRIAQAVDPCIVYMTQFGKDPHVGVYVGGKVLHFTRTCVEYLPLPIATRCFNDVRFYK